MASPKIKANLLNDQNTPAKMVVSCDINSWLQTNLKKMPQNIPKSRAISRLLETNLSLKTKSIEYSNIDSLKNRKTDLLRSTTKAFSNKVLTTRPSTNQKIVCQSSEQTKKNSQLKEISEFKIQLHEIKVSEFSENVPPSVIKYHKQMPPLSTKSINKGTKVSQKGISKNIHFIQSKMLSHRNIIPLRKRSSKLLFANPEANNLVFKTRRILSVNEPNSLS